MRKFFNAAQAASAVLAACALTIAVSPLRAGAATSSTGSVVFSDVPGTSAPPPALGPYTMTAFAADSQPVGSDVNSVAAPGGTLGFSPALAHALVGHGWNTWSNGYTGDVYLVSGKYVGTLTYTIRDSFGFSVNDIFYHGIGQDMRYLQTNCGNPPRKGGAQWFPDSVTAMVHFSLPTG